jgi:hypothetical protein
VNRAEKPAPPPGIIHGIANDGSIIVQFHSEEWKRIPGFHSTSEDKHGGAIGKLATASSIQLQRPVSEVTLRGTDSNLPITPSVNAPKNARDVV